MGKNILRYYATFKVRKCESLFYQINTFLPKNLPLAKIYRLQTEQYSLKICNIHIFSILSLTFAVPFLCYFQKFHLLLVKKFWNKFCCIVFLFLWAPKLCLRCLKSYFKLEILIFLYFMGSYSIYVQVKSSFFDEKWSAVKSKTHFSKEAIEN